VTKFSNIAVDTNFASSITDAETSKAVDSATGWPAAPFNLQCEDEVIRVNTKSGTTFSDMTRGYDGTTAVAHTTTPTVSHVVVAEDIGLIRGPRLDRPDLSDAKSDDFDGTALSSTWTLLGNSEANFDTAPGSSWVELQSSASGTASTGQRGGFGIYQSAPAGDFDIRCKMSAILSDSATLDDARLGIFVGITSGKAYILGLQSSVMRVMNYMGINSYSRTAYWGAYDGTDVYHDFGGDDFGEEL